MNSEIAAGDSTAMAAATPAPPVGSMPSGVSSLNSPAAAIDAAGNSFAQGRERKRLPDRRRTWRERAAWTGSGVDLFFFVDLGVDADGRPAEIFIVAATGKVGSLLAMAAHDLAVSLSHFLRIGVSLEELHDRYAEGSLARWACATALAIEDRLIDEGAL
jgi:hypothetical protein